MQVLSMMVLLVFGYYLHAHPVCRLIAMFGTVKEHSLNDGSSRICQRLRSQLPKGLAIEWVLGYKGGGWYLHRNRLIKG